MVKSSGLAYNIIRNMILDGRYPPSAHLREEAIATEIGMSRTPVREALRRLEADGYVTVRPNQGAFVSDWSDESFSELISLRAELAGIAARGAAQHIRRDDIDALDEIVAAMSAIKSDPHATIDRQTALNLEFHAVIFRNCGNRWVELVLKQTSQVANVQRAYHAYTPADWVRSVARYGELVAALRRGDGEWASAILKSHFLASRDAVMSRGGLSPIAPAAAAEATAKRARPVRRSRSGL